MAAGSVQSLQNCEWACIRSSGYKTPQLSVRGNMVFDLQDQLGDSQSPRSQTAYCQVKPSSIYLFPLCQLLKLESVQWNWSPYSCVHTALLPVRLHLAVNVDSSWTAIHIRNALFSSILLLCLPLIATVCVCHISMIYDELQNSTTSHQCVYKAPSALTMPLFIAWRKTEYCTLLFDGR